MSGLAKFSVDVTSSGHGKVVINGNDVSESVNGLALESRVGQPPLLRLYFLAAAGPIEGEGIVHVVEDQVDWRAQLRTSLGRIDPRILEKEVLKRCGWGDSATEATLNILKEWLTDESGS